MAKSEKLTPMMRQYQEIKAQYPDTILFFRLGDFYEMFGDDAVTVSGLLNLVLTKRQDAPMCGIPYHAAGNYLKRLLDAGQKVAICEQLSLPENSKELAKREVVGVFTPGTVVDEEYLDSLSPSYILAVTLDRKGTHLAWADISTGGFFIRSFPLSRDLSAFRSELEVIAPKEILVSDDLYFTEKEFRQTLDLSGAIITKLPASWFGQKQGIKETERQFTSRALELFQIDPKDPVLSPMGALLRYVRENTKSDMPQLRAVERRGDESCLLLDASAVRNLELLKNLSGGKEGSLFSVINRTKTASGARFLREAILHPLADISRINERLGWVEGFVKDREEMNRVRRLLGGTSDLERLSVNASLKKLSPRGLIGISDTIISFFTLVAGREDYLRLGEDFSPSFNELLALAEDIAKAVNRECTNLQKEGTVILSGYDEELDEAREYLDNGSDILRSYIERLKEECGIVNMKAGENKIIGAYIEVSKSQVSLVPSSFRRIQTLVGGERYTTSELDRIKEEIATAADKAAKKERELFNVLQDRASALCLSIEAMGKILSLLDYYSSLAFLAVEQDYVRPEVKASGDLEIRDGRHPVVEHFTGRAEYVANSFSTEKSRFSLITGPNMAGKSTFLRQTALIVLLCHMGSYVPAREASVPLTDKIFCRVGASDNLSRGESTFLVEMAETSSILRSATERSLVIMDEIGRGTSTEDGMSIAYAVMQYLRKLGSITLFATHYHELTMLDTSGLQLLHMAVREENSTITFLRKAEEGVSASSYGIHVAKLAGLPREVIREATQFQKRHFADYTIDSDQGDLFTGTGEEKEDEASKEVLSELAAFDTSASTPLQALVFIAELQKKLT